VGQIGLGQVELGQVGLGWVRLGWVRLGRLVGQFDRSVALADLWISWSGRVGSGLSMPAPTALATLCRGRHRKPTVLI
jgi:hypothetical protein